MISRITVVVVTHNSADVIEECLASIELHGGGARAVVVDNASSDASAEIAAASPIATVLRSERNVGFSAANNLALRNVSTTFALVLNPDARLTASTLPALVTAAERHAEAAALGPLTTHPDGRPQVSFGEDLGLFSEFRQRRLVKGVKASVPWAVEAWRAASSRERTVDWISGSCMLLRTAEIRGVGFFDERYFLYEEDADLCLRLRKVGKQVMFIPQAIVIHALGTSMAKSSDRARDAYDASHLLYYRLHRGPFERWVLATMVALRRFMRSA